MNKQMDYITEEIEAINFNINAVNHKIEIEGLSVEGVVMARQLIDTLKKMKTILERENDNHIELITSLPLLYFKIPILK